MTWNDDSIFRASLDRCQAVGGFFDRFYATFLAAAPEIPALFARVNMTRQAEMLAESLAIIRQAGSRPDVAGAYIDEIGQFHARLGVPKWMYDLWLDCLVRTAGDCDPDFSPEVAAAWRAVMGAGIAQMKGVGVPTLLPTARSSTDSDSSVTGPTASPPG